MKSGSSPLATILLYEKAVRRSFAVGLCYVPFCAPVWSLHESPDAPVPRQLKLVNTGVQIPAASSVEGSFVPLSYSCFLFLALIIISYSHVRKSLQKSTMRPSLLFAFALVCLCLALFTEAFYDNGAYESDTVR